MLVQIRVWPLNDGGDATAVRDENIPALPAEVENGIIKVGGKIVRPKDPPLPGLRHRWQVSFEKIEDIWQAVRALRRGCDTDPRSETATADVFPEPKQKLLPIRSEHELAIRVLSLPDPLLV